MDTRSTKILEMIVNTPNVTGKVLEDNLNLSRKQLGYSISKINDYLVSHGFEAIERQRTGKFIVSQRVLQEFADRVVLDSDDSIIYSEKERVYLIALIILTRKQQLSSYDFADLLQISKNTFLLDLKKLHVLLNQFNLKYEYSREAGYKIVGGEFDKRLLMTESIRKMLNELNNEKLLAHFCNLDEAMLNEIKQALSNVEKSLKIRFTDERYRELIFILATQIYRAKQGKILMMDQEPLQSVIGTEEYIVAVRVADHFGIINDNEVLSITLLINISNTNNFESNNHINSRIKDAAIASIDNFEEICCVKLDKKDQLLKALLQHCTPAYFRIKYNFHVKNDFSEEVILQYSHLHAIVRKATLPFAELIGKEIPDNELAYLTILFGSWMKREGLLESINEKKKAVVVCSKGITVSNYLYITLSELLPEIDFITWLSQRELKNYRGKYDLIFTTERLDINKKQFVVSPIFNNILAKQNFREKVLNEIYGSNYHLIQVDSMIEIVQKYADFKNIRELRKEFEAYVQGQSNEYEEKAIEHIEAPQDGVHLSDLLNEDTITLHSSQKDWQKVIKTASKPLIKTKAIEPRYLDAMIADIKLNHPFNMIAPGLFIAHAGVDQGVNQIAMAMTLLPKPIAIDGYIEADIFIVLATPDVSSHLVALYELIDITEDEKKMKALRNAKDIEEIKKIISGLEK